MLDPRKEYLDVTINKIKKNAILLPDFQRQFVWKEEEIQKKLDVSDFKKGEVSTKVKNLDGCPILPVPSARMKTAYTFYDGETAGQEGGGFKPAEGAKAINWIITPRNVPIAVSKTDVTRIFDPMTNQLAHAWKIDYRKYHELWIPEKKFSALWVSKEA